MNHDELNEALEWLRAAVSVGENALRGELAAAVKQEWEMALECKRDLLKKLEEIRESFSAQIQRVEQR